MKISKVLFAFIGCQTTSDALPLSDELKALSNFDSWADSVTSSVPFGKEPSLGVPHSELPFVIYRLLKKSNVWASRHLLAQAQDRFVHQSFEMASDTLMLMSDLINQSSNMPEGRVARILGRSASLAAKGDELAELIDAWDMAAHSITLNPLDNLKETKLDSKRTEDAAGRLRGIRADLFQLLNGLPDSYFEQSNNENDDEGSASGDYQYDSQLDNKDDDTVELVFDTSTGTFDDVALLVRNGALDESLLKSNLNANQATLEDGNEQDSRGHGLFEKESNDAEPVYDMPSFEKYMAGRRQEPRIINGQNKSNNSWLGYSLLGSIGAIFVTVSATVCVRRVKSKKDQTSGTPIQKLKRYQGHQINQSQQNRPGRSLNHVNFTGYNPAFRPQYFNPNQSVNGGFSSAMSSLSSGGSGFGMQNQMPKQPVVQQHFQPNPNLARAMSMSSGYTSENRSNAPLTQGPQDRALPPPPYAKVQY